MILLKLTNDQCSFLMSVLNGIQDGREQKAQEIYIALEQAHQIHQLESREFSRVEMSRYERR
jgi:hypothetical protein